MNENKIDIYNSKLNDAFDKFKLNLFANNNFISDFDKIVKYSKKIKKHLNSQQSSNTNSNNSNDILQSDAFIKLQYSNCYGTTPLFYLMVIINRNIYYIPIYDRSIDFVSKIGHFYIPQLCNIKYTSINNEHKLISCNKNDLNCDVLNEYLKNNNIMYTTLIDCENLEMQKNTYINMINLKINKLCDEISANNISDDMIYDIPYKTIAEKCKNQKEIRLYLSNCLKENNAKLIAIICDNNCQPEFNVATKNQTLNELIACIKLNYNHDINPFNPTLYMSLIPQNINCSDEEYANQMFYMPYRILLFNLINVLDDAFTYIDEIKQIIHNNLHNEPFYNFKINRIKKKSIVLQNIGLIHDIRKIHTPTKNNKFINHSIKII